MKSTNTLKNSNEFGYIMKHGSWFAGDLIIVYLLQNRENCNLLGIAVGKKFSKSSVKRNRVRRLIKEAYRLEECNIKIGYSIVILLKNNINFENISFEKIRNDLLKCIERADIIVKEEEYNA